MQRQMFTTGANLELSSWSENETKTFWEIYLVLFLKESPGAPIVRIICYSALCK